MHETTQAVNLPLQIVTKGGCCMESLRVVGLFVLLCVQRLFREPGIQMGCANAASSTSTLLGIFVFARTVITIKHLNGMFVPLMPHSDHAIR